MNFTDYLFIPLFLILTVVYFIFPKNIRWLVLLGASGICLCTWGLELLPIAFVVVFIAWLSALLMGRNHEKQDKSVAKKKNKRILIISIISILLFLIYVKTQKMIISWGWGAQLVCFISDIYQNIISCLLKLPYISMFVRDVQAGDTSIVHSFFVPLGISYYTFSLIGYLLDVYWKKEKAEKNYLKLMLFAIYFPKVFQGPISKHRDIAAKLNEGHSFDYNRYCRGWQRMLWGYFKKLVIADRLSIFVNMVFGNYESYHGSQFLIAAIFGAFQMYCDFSGCMDIALGASQIFGIELEENFDKPFMARSASEFWRRWHITLGAWFRDYLYLPVSRSNIVKKISKKTGNRYGAAARKNTIIVISSTVVWMATGLWHGTGWNYIVWGIYWDILILTSTIFENQIKKLTKMLRIDTEAKGYVMFQRLRTFFLFVIARIITIPNNLTVTWEIFKGIITDFAPWKLVDGTIYDLGLDRPNFNLAVIVLILLMWVDVKQERGVVIREKIELLPIVLRWIFWILAIFAVLIFGVYGVGYDASAFIYMNY